MYVDVEQKNWDEILPFVTFAYNTAKQETTGFTPFYLLHGREAETTLDTMLPFCPNDFDDNNITNIAGNIDHRFTTAYHPQTNGLTERFNKTLADMLSMYVDVEQKNWDEILPFVTFAYNTAKQETTGFTPFYLLHGREAETTLDTMLPFCPNDFDDNNITKIAARAEESRQYYLTRHFLTNYSITHIQNVFQNFFEDYNGK
ncbi:retrovirus-related Pol polyprotein from transposon 412 [Trichonephila clavipes]|nr:retrovirus-related Pol polyprotein from transposon 412 [Trichonephila clavipes]